MPLAGGQAVCVVEVAARVARAPINKIELRIVRAGHPRRATAEFPALALPGFVTFLAGTGDDVPAPGQASGLDVERRQVAAMRGVAASAADDDLVLHHQGRRGDVAPALARIVDADLPDFLARLLIQCDHVIVRRAEEHLAIADRDTAILHEGHAAGAAGTRRRIFVMPDQIAGSGVEREHLKVRRDDVHNAVQHDGRGEQPLAVVARLKNPGRLQAADVAGVDLIERAIAPGEIRAAVARPVGAGGALGTSILGIRGRGEERRGETKGQKLHRDP